MSVGNYPIEDRTQSALVTDYVIPRYGFTINGQNILQNPDLPSEYSVINEIFKLPHSPPWFRGLVNQHNTLIPVYDVSRLINNSGIKARKNMQTNLLTIKIDNEMVGLLIDDVPTFIEGNLESIQDFEVDWPDTINASIESIYKNKSDYWVQISYRKLFLSLASQKL